MIRLSTIAALFPDTISDLSFELEENVGTIRFHIHYMVCPDGKQILAGFTLCIR